MLTLFYGERGLVQHWQHGHAKSTHTWSTEYGHPVDHMSTSYIQMVRKLANF